MRRRFEVKPAIVAAAAGLMLLGAGTGVGLGMFATGGDYGAMIARERGKTPLGANPDALFPDRAGEIADAGYAGPILCQECGGWAEEQAIAGARAYAARVARQAAAHDGASDRPPRRTPEPAYVPDPRDEMLVPYPSAEEGAVEDAAPAQPVETGITG